MPQPVEVTKGEPKSETNNSSRKAKAKKSRPGNPTTTTKPTIRKVPMATYDSKKKELHLVRKADVNGEVMHTSPVSISLEGLTEDERQLAVSIAKVAINYAKAHDPTTKPKNNGKEGRSLVDKLLSVVKRLKSSHETRDPKDQESQISLTKADDKVVKSDEVI